MGATKLPQKSKRKFKIGDNFLIRDGKNNKIQVEVVETDGTESKLKSAWMTYYLSNYIVEKLIVE